MIFLLRDKRQLSEQQFFCVRLKSLPPESDPCLGFTSIQQLQRFCEFSKIPSDAYEVVTLRPRLATSQKAVALFASDREVNECFGNPQLFRYEDIVVPLLDGYAAYIPLVILRLLARYA